MTKTELVELADRYARRRAILAAAAALAFLAIQIFVTPRVFGGESGTRIDLWAVNAIVLLAILATGGGILSRRKVRELVNDDVARGHLRTAVIAGHWVAMTTAVVLYLAPWSRSFTSRQAIYLIVTGSVVVSLLTFAALERRALADA